MAFVQPFGQYLTGRLGPAPLPAQAIQQAQLQQALGPILAAPQATGPQYSVAQMLADSSTARPLPVPGLQPAPEPVPAAPQTNMIAQAAQIAQALNPGAMPGAAGAAAPSGEATSTPASTAAPIMDAIKGFFTGNAPSMTGAMPVATDADNASAAATLGKPEGTMDAIGSWLSNLLGGDDAAAPPSAPAAPAAGPVGAVPAGAAAPVVPAVPAGAAVPVGGLGELVTPSPREGIAPIATQAYKGIPFLTDPTTGRALEPGQAPAQPKTDLHTAQAEQMLSRQERGAKAGTAVTEALAATNPNMPKEEASAVKSVFENEDLYKMMIATGAALDSGLSYGEAMLAGSQAFLGSQAARKKLTDEEAAKVAAAAQQRFDNEIALYNAGKGEKKDAALVKLYEIRAEAEKAGIPLKALDAKLKEANIDLAKARTGAANRSNQPGTSGGGSGGSGGGGDLSDKDYAARVSQNRQNFAGNSIVGGNEADLDDQAQAYTNSLLSEGNRRYKPVTADTKKEIKTLLDTPNPTPEQVERARFLYNLHGDINVE